MPCSFCSGLQGGHDTSPDLGEVLDRNFLTIDGQDKVLGRQASKWNSSLVGDHHLEVDNSHIQDLGENPGQGIGGVLRT